MSEITITSWNPERLLKWARFALSEAKEHGVGQRITLVLKPEAEARKDEQTPASSE